MEGGSLADEQEGLGGECKVCQGALIAGHVLVGCEVLFPVAQLRLEGLELVSKGCGILLRTPGLSGSACQGLGWLGRMSIKGA